MTYEETRKLMRRIMSNPDCDCCDKHYDNMCLGNCVRVMEIADRAIDRQTPRKVIRKFGGTICPNCRTIFEYRMDNWKSPFCQYCGQALEWEEV